MQYPTKVKPSTFVPGFPVIKTVLLRGNRPGWVGAESPNDQCPFHGPLIVPANLVNSNCQLTHPAPIQH